MTSAEESIARLQPDVERIVPILVWHSEAEDYRRAILQRLPRVPVEARSGSGRAKPSEARVLLTWSLPPGAKSWERASTAWSVVTTSRRAYK